MMDNTEWECEVELFCRQMASGEWMVLLIDRQTGTQCVARNGRELRAALERFLNVPVKEPTADEDPDNE